MASGRSRLCDTCPRKLNSVPTEACPAALERIHAMQAESMARGGKAQEVITGCSWAINSPENSYCFWGYAKSLDSPISDKEISELLGLPLVAIDRAYQSAIEKLKSLKDTDAIQELRDTVTELVSNRGEDHTVYFPDKFIEAVNKEDSKVKEAADPGAPKKRGKKAKRIPGLPVHRGGVKTDLYGLYSRKTMERISKEKKEAKDKK